MPAWLGVMDMVNVVIFSVILVAGTIAISWARAQARAAEQKWQAEGRPAMDAAVRSMDEMHDRLAKLAEGLRGTGDAVVARVRKDTGRR